MIKALIAALILSATISTQAWAISWSLVSNVCAGSSDGKTVTTGAINTNGATLFAMTIACSASVSCSPTSVTDSTGSNTWLLAQGQYNGGQGQLFYYVISPVTNSSQTFTVNFGSNSSLPSVCVLAENGGNGITLESSKSTNGGSSITTVTDGGITPQVTGELLVSSADANSASVTINSVNLSYTIPAGGTQAPSANNWALGIGYLVSASTSYQQATWTASSSANLSAGVFGFTLGTTTGPTGTAIVNNGKINNANLN